MNAVIMFSGRLKKISRQVILFVAMIVCGINSFAQPANDEPCAAITLTVNPTCTYQTFTNALATASVGVPDPGCAQYLGSDVWFQVVVPAGGALIFDSQEGVITDGGMAIYSGDCNNLVLIECDDDDSPNGLMSYIYRTGLTPGSTIWVRFWEYQNNNNGTFGICVTVPPPPPANDECIAAVSLTANPDQLCASSANGTTVSGTPSTAPAATCAAAGTNDDVWYSFVATSPIHSVSLTNVTGIVTDMAMALYSGGCGSLVQVQCSDPNNFTVNGLTIGQTYYVRVWTVSTAANGANFTICVGTPPPPPINDDPCNAIELIVPENGSCNYQTFTNESSTNTQGVPAPGCANYQGGDVWFKLIVPCSGSIVLDGQTGFITDGGMAVYSGDCTALSLIACDDDNSVNGFMPHISTSGLVPGSILWVRFWEYGGDANGTFGICAQVPPPPPPAASCQTAQSFCTSVIPSTVPNITGIPSTTGGGTDPTFGCLGTVPNPTYYYLQIQNSGSISITISQTSTTGNPLDVDFIVWGPFANLSATCTGISAANIVDCSYLPAAIEVADIPAATAGEYYLFLVTNFSNQPGAITYQQTGGTGSSNCNIVCTLNAGNSGPVCSDGLLNLTASTVTSGTYLWSGPNCFTSVDQNPTGVTAPHQPGVYVYTVTATAPNGTTCSDTTLVTVSPKPVLAADSTITICSGATVDLTPIYNTTGLTISWLFGGIAVANPAAVNVSGIYQLIGANATGCTDTAEVTLLVDTVTTSANFIQVACTQTATITATNTSGILPIEYSISTNPGVYQASNAFTVLNAGTFTVSTRDSLGCISSTDVIVTLNPPFKISAGPDLQFFSGEQGQISGSSLEPVTNIMWSPITGLSATNTLTPIVQPAGTTIYTLTATNSFGCIASDDVLVEVIPYCITVKNAFTPNGDGINDTWQVYDKFDCLKNVTVHIFNRYGNTVYESKNYRNTWDGRYKGKSMPDGTYYAVIEYLLITDKVQTVKTDLTILR
ncbi:MAG: gliding motility-associated C-terminal domain-containing protein [Ferruginibacter sp.]